MKKKALFTVLTASLMCAAAAVTFAACGETKTYTVTYEKYSTETGSVPTDSTKYKKGEEVTVKGKNDLDLNGYTFSGWTYGDTTYTEGQKIKMPDKNITLTASWTLIPVEKYTINFAANVEDEGLTLPNAIVDVEAGTEIDLSEYTVSLEGYEFVHWLDGSTVYEANATYTVTGNATLTAVLREEAFSQQVTLEATYDGTSYTGDVDDWGCWYKEIEIEGEAGKYYTLKLESDEIAVCLTEDLDSGVGVNFDQLSTLFKMPQEGKITLYIVGAIDMTPDGAEEAGDKVSLTGKVTVLQGGSGTITFRKDEGFGPMYAAGSEVVEAGETIDELPAAPEYLEGYVFEGWYLENGDEFTTETVITSDLTVIAKWTAVQYDNGLTEGNETAMVDALGNKTNGKYTITLGGADKFTRPGYELVGWEIGETTYALGAEVEIDAGEQVSITAVWFDGNDEIDELEITAFTTQAQYVYPGKLVAGQKVIIEGTYTGSSNNVFAGVMAMISDDATLAKGAIPQSFVRFRYDNFFGNHTGQDGDEGYTAVTNFIVSADRIISFSDGTGSWFDDYTALVAALNGTAGTLKIEIDYTSGAYILVTYTLSGNVKIGTEAAASNHTFVQQYKVTNSQSDEFIIALIGDAGKLENATVTRVSAASDKIGATENGISSVNGGTYTYTAVTQEIASPNDTVWNGYAPAATLTKGNELLIYGTQTSAVDLVENWFSIMWEFSEGYTGRSDNYGWTYLLGEEQLPSKLGSNVNGAGANAANKNYVIIKADGTVSTDWADFKAIAKNCTFTVHATWLEDGYVTVTLTLTSAAGTFVNCVQLAIDDNTVEAYNLHIGGDHTTLNVTGFATVTHPVADAD